MIKHFVSRVLRRVRHQYTQQYYRIKHPRFEAGAGLTIKGKLVVRGPGRVVIGERCQFDNATGRPNVLWTHSPEALIQIGDDCYINGAEINARTAITLGNRCLVADCLFLDTDFHSVSTDRQTAGAVAKTAPITIQENVWIGNRTMILKGVSVGANSVVGAGAVVRTSVPANVVVLGNPHQIVKHLPAAAEGVPE